MRWAVVSLLALASGCGALIDTTYLLGSNGEVEIEHERAPTGHSRVATEYAAWPTGDGRLELSCRRRERAVERAWTTTRRYEYRGSYRGSWYYGAAAMSTILGAVTAGALVGICLDDEANASCWNVLWASPWALDAGWSLLRGATAKEPKLVGKQRSRAGLRFAEVPTRDEPVACDPVVRLVVGKVTGPDEDALLNGIGSAAERALADGAEELTRDADGKAVLDAAVMGRWAARPQLGLFAQDDTGLHEVEVDRCSLLRRYAASLSHEQHERFLLACPLPAPPGQR